MKLTATQLGSLRSLSAYCGEKAQSAKHAAEVCDPILAEEFRDQSTRHAAWKETVDAVIARAQPAQTKTLRLHVVEGGRP